MRLFAQVCAYLAGLPLQVLVISALIRGPWRRYPFILAWAMADFLTTAREIWPSLTYDSAPPQVLRTFNDIYWVDERILQVLVFLMVISLVYEATRQMQPRRTLLLGTVLGTAAVAAITFSIHYNSHILTGRWMTPWTRDLNFCAAILDFGLWTMLIGARERDFRLLMVSGALGIQFTGDAIGQSLRGMSASVQAVGAAVIPWVNIACTYMMWQAFRARRKVPVAERTTLNPESPPAAPDTGAQIGRETAK
jgi:hypothetical protein